MLKGGAADGSVVKVWDASNPREARAADLKTWHSRSAGMAEVAEEVASQGEAAPVDHGIVPVSFVSTEVRDDNPPALNELPELSVQTPAISTADSLTVADPQSRRVTESTQPDKSKSPQPEKTPSHSRTPDSGNQLSADASQTGMPSWMAETRPQTLDLGELIARLVIATGIVLVLAVLAVVAVRKWMGPALSPRIEKSSRLRLIESLPLPQRASLQLVELDGRPVLVGMNSGGLQTITPVERSFSESLYSMDQDEAGRTQEESCDDGQPEVCEADAESDDSASTGAVAGSWTEMIAESLNLNPSPTAERNLKAG